MTKFDFAAQLRCGVACAILATALITPVYAIAQDAPQQAEEDSKQVIVVTGSRIRKTDEFNTADPLTVITSDEITEAGFNSIGEALQSSQITQGGGQINNYFAGFVVDGGTGVNTVGLRGMGPERTLVLLNGRRLAPAGTRGSVGVVDLNVLPTAIVDRIDVFKAGASSVYGSDAVTGVINIVTDTKLKGLVLEAQGNLPEVGAGSYYRVSGSFGVSGERYRLIGSLEYYRRHTLSRNDVNWTKCPIGGYLSGEGTPFGSGDYVDPLTGQPKCFTLDNGGVTINTLGVPGRTAQDRLTGALGTYSRLVPDASVTGGNTPGYSGVSYYTRDTFDPRQEEEELVTPAKVITGFLQGGYDLDALGNAELYVELIGNRRESSSTLYRQLTLDYAQGSPLLPLMFRNGAFLAPNEISNGNIVAARSFIGFGNTKSEQRVDFFRTAGGLRGELPFNDWRYDFYTSYSWSDAKYKQETFLTDRIAQSLDVVQNPDGSFSCVDPSGGCVAAPPVDAASIGGNLSQAYRDYILANVGGTTKYNEFIAAFNVDGPIFSLPGGQAQIALGAEYRDAKINDTPPLDSINNNLYNLTSATPTRGSDSVWELYGEVDLPILSDVPGARRLSLGGSARYTHYDSYGGGWTYKVQGDWEPVKGLKLRGSYGTSYRAPALFEQFLGATSGFLSSSSDPCDDYANKSSPTLQANCAAIGLPSSFIQTSGVQVLTAGGAASGLKAETSKNLSFGVVVSPPIPQALGRVSMAADYFSIKVENGVARAGALNILDRCYNDPTFNPNAGFCRLVSRDSNNIVTVNNNYVNLATDQVKGIEFNVRYENQIGPGMFTLNALVTKFTNQSSKLFDDEALVNATGTIGRPDWTASLDAKFKVGRVSIRYGMDWVSGDSKKTYIYNAKDSAGQVDTAYLQFLKDSYKLSVKDYFTHDLSMQLNIGDNYQITGGVRNLFDAHPPRISADIYDLVGNSPLYSGYDYVGRTFFLNITTQL
ncbi:MAG: TonB-dependent receptor [Sphingomonadaceae bacterium]|jgi:outer membrane receptor protein involved in Fe transport